METKMKVRLERLGIWAGIVGPAAVSLLWLGSLDTRVQAADQDAKDAAAQIQPVSEKMAALDERTKAIQQSIEDIKKQQAQQAADNAAAQREIIAALRGRRGN